VVLKICERTERQRDIQTYRHADRNTKHSYREQSNKYDTLGVRYDITSNFFVLSGLIDCMLQISHVAWFMCVCVGYTGELCRNGWTDRDAVRRLTHVGPRNQLLDGFRSPIRRGTFEGDINVTTHGQCACPAHAVVGYVRRREGWQLRRCDLLPNYFRHLFYPSVWLPWHSRKAWYDLETLRSTQFQTFLKLIEFNFLCLIMLFFFGEIYY